MIQMNDGFRYISLHDNHMHTPDSSAAHLSVSEYSNSRSGDSDSPCAQHKA